MATHAADAPAQPRKRRKLTIFLRVFLVLLVLLFAAGLLAPTVLSTRAGRGFVEGIVGDSLAGSLKVGSLTLSWFGGQQIEDVQLEDARGNTIMLQELRTELTLWRALLGNLDLGKTRLRGLEVDIVVKEPAAAVKEAGNPGKPQSGASPASPSFPAGMGLENLLPASLILDAKLTQARITVTRPRAQPVVIDDLDVSVSRAARGDPLAFQVSGRSRQGSLSGSFTGKGRLHGVFGKGEQPRAQVSVAVRDLPTDGVDGLLDLGGVLRAGLGPTINLQLDSTSTAQAQDLSVRVDCANLTARFAGRTEGGRFALGETATVRTTVTPELVRRLVADGEPGSPLRMTAPLPIQLTIDRFSSPVDGLDLSEVAMDARLESGSGTSLTGLGGSDLAHLELRRLAAAVATGNLARSLDLKLDGRLAQGTDPASAEVTTVRVNLKVSDFLDELGRARLDRLGLEGLVAIDGLSMALVDRLLGQRALAREIIGPRLGLFATSSTAGNDKTTIKLDIRSTGLQVGTIALELANRLSLHEPVVVRATVPGELLARLVERDPPIGVRSAVPVELTIDRFSAPRPHRGEPLFQPDSTSLEARLTAGPLRLAGVPQLGNVTAAGTRLSVRGGSLSALEVDGSLQISQPDPGGVLGELTGAEPLKVAMKASGGLTPQGIATDVTLSLESPRMMGRASARLSEGLAAVGPEEALELRLVVVPALLECFGLARPGLRLKGPATVLVNLDRARLPLGHSLAELEVEGRLGVDRVTMEGDGTWSGASLHGARVSFAFRDGSGTARLEGKATVPGQERPGSLAVDAKVGGLFGEGEKAEKASLDATVRMDDLATSFVDALANQQGRLALIGPTFGCHATARLEGLDLETASGVLDARVQSRNLTVDAGLNLGKTGKTGKTIGLGRPVKVTLRLTPEGYRGLAATGDEASPLELREPATIEATIESLAWPRRGGGPGMVHATAKAGSMRLWNRATDKTVRIEGLTATARSADIAKDLQVEIAGNLDETGKVGVSLAVRNLLTDAGDTNLEGVSARLNAELRELPVAALDAWLGCDGLLLAALGQHLTVTATSTLEKMNGPLQARLEASQARATLDGLLQDKAIRLNKPLTLELNATPKLGERLLSRLHPFLKGITTGTAIKVTIHQDGVRVPLADFGLDRLVVPKTTVDLGKVTLETDVVMRGLLALARRPQPEQLAAWFTPAVFSIRSGTVTFRKRLDILFDKDFHVATWGSADLRSGAYRQTLALTGPTLSKQFHLDNIEQGEMFRIPIRGVADAPRIDYARAAADLARLKAEDRALSELTKRLERLPAIARGLLEKQVKNAARKLSGSLGGRQGPVPPPSARPLPWK